MQTHLQQHGIEYYTYDKPEERPYRVMLRGLPLVDPQSVLGRFKEELGHLKSRCNSCGEAHGTETCPVKETPVKRCANCGGAHPAMDRGCPKRAEYLQIRQQATTANQPGRRSKKVPTAPSPITTNFPTLTNSSATVETPKFAGPSFATITKTN